MRARVAAAVESLTPGYFALVMATGIISVGLALENVMALSRVLLVVCVVAFVTLLALNAWRFVTFRGAVVDDFMDPRRAFGFFTLVAGTNVLANRLASSSASRTVFAVIAANPRKPCDDTRICIPRCTPSAGSFVSSMPRATIASQTCSGTRVAGSSSASSVTGSPSTSRAGLTFQRPASSTKSRM